MIRASNAWMESGILRGLLFSSCRSAAMLVPCFLILTILYGNLLIGSMCHVPMRKLNVEGWNVSVKIFWRLPPSFKGCVPAVDPRENPLYCA
jgi:hypothetical protein